MIDVWSILRTDKFWILSSSTADLANFGGRTDHESCHTWTGIERGIFSVDEFVQEGFFLPTCQFVRRLPERGAMGNRLLKQAHLLSSRLGAAGGNPSLLNRRDTLA